MLRDRVAQSANLQKTDSDKEGGVWESWNLEIAFWVIYFVLHPGLFD